MTQGSGLFIRLLGVLEAELDRRVDAMAAALAARGVAKGDRVLVLVRFEGRDRASGTPATTFTGGQLFTLRAGKVVRLDLFTSTKEALEAAGLPNRRIKQPSFRWS